MFGSHWNCTTGGAVTCSRTDNGTYAFGVDPQWMFKDNELIFTNSMKMKIAVSLGITQMMFGMVLQLIKQVRRRAWIELWLGWLPQVMYLGSFFVYMVALIVIKWCDKKNRIGEEGVNLIQVLISMILSPTSIEGRELYPHQGKIQNGVIIVFISSIPLMLIVKPIVEMAIHGVGNGILECFVVTLIDTIEFTLSALSHTASYLRLWALSLAHSQLAHVLWDQLFLRGFGVSSSVAPVMMFVMFAGWAVGSVVILLGMECFSSLLHGIRLMWVEFSSKFYSGTGYPFMPLSFEREVTAMVALKKEKNE
jgi:V-type H+-transporting ATPase subunit a